MIARSSSRCQDKQWVRSGHIDDSRVGRASKDIYRDATDTKSCLVSDQTNEYRVEMKDSAGPVMPQLQGFSPARGCHRRSYDAIRFSMKTTIQSFHHKRPVLYAMMLSRRFLAPPLHPDHAIFFQRWRIVHRLAFQTSLETKIIINWVLKNITVRVTHC